MSTPASMQSGKSFGPYQIADKIGEGGMGEVYRARDRRLARDVALKVLPPALASSVDRTARFQREAQVLASLNHPGIAQIYGLEESEGASALAMELVDGQTLEQRIGTGPLPLDRALDIARQLAEALEYAHDRGVVHRDLKPANIMLTPDGSVKVLDFGLAKAIQGSGSDSGAPVANPADSPTITLAAVNTTGGMILGTAAYMSPEQARGQAIDRRTDIWAFGAILFEMLSGKQAFGGETASDSVAAVISRDPDWSLLPPSTPAAIRRLLARCLNKLLKVRLQAIGEARIAIDDYVGAGDAPPETAPARARSWPWMLAAGVSAAAAIALAVLYRRPAEPPPVARFQIDPPAGVAYMNRPEVAPNGRMVLAIVRTNLTTPSRIAVRSLDSLDSRILPGTEGARQAVWSPNSRSIAFERGGKLTVYEIATGASQEVQDGLAGAQLFSWTPDGRIAFGTFNKDGVWSVPSSGGVFTPTPAVTANEPGATANARAIPGGYIFESKGPDGATRAVRAVRNGGKPSEASVVVAGSTPRFAPGKPPYIFYVRDDNLYAQPFDVSGMNATGRPAPIASGVSDYSVSDATLAYSVSNVLERQYVWSTVDGRPLGNAGDSARFYRAARLSPDGTRLAAAIAEKGTRSAGAALWIEDFRRGALTRLTFGADQAFTAVWSPDGSEIAYALRLAANGFAVNRIRTDGSGQPAVLSKSDRPIQPDDWSSDGRFLLVTRIAQSGGQELWAGALEGGSNFKLVDGASGRFSPDAKWVAYTSRESGRSEVFARPFDGTPGPSGKFQISTEGAGQGLAWSPDGKAIYYSSPSGDRLFRVDVSASGGSLRAGRPVAIMDLPQGIQGDSLAVAPDGKRLLYGVPVTKSPQYYATTVVLNWRSALADQTPQQ